jgi:hypothetical protein
MKKDSKETQALFQFLSGYFYQCWDQDYNYDDEAINDYMNSASTENKKLCVVAIDNLLSMNLSNDDLGEKIFELGSYLSAEDFEMTNSDWLKKIKLALLEDISNQ